MNGLYTLKGLNASGSQAGMTRSAHHRLDRRQRIIHTVIPAPDQVENDVKDTVYQTAGITYPVIPDTSGIAFFKDGIPNQVGNDIFVIFIVILTHIIRY